MKKIIFAFLILSFTSVNAGIYIEINGGVADVNYQNDPFGEAVNPSTNTLIIAPKTTQSGSFALGFLSGWEFNKYFSLEGGFYNFSGQKTFDYYETITNGWNVTDTYNIGQIQQHNTNAFVVDAKGSVPISALFPLFLYGKIGAASVRTEFDAQEYATYAPTYAQSLSDSVTKTEPMIALGADYNILGSLKISLEWMYIAGSQTQFSIVGNNQQVVSMGNWDIETPAINMFSVGIEYLF